MRRIAEGTGVNLTCLYRGLPEIRLFDLGENVRDPTEQSIGILAGLRTDGVGGQVTIRPVVGFLATVGT
jgi:hypothetical protein